MIINPNSPTSIMSIILRTVLRAANRRENNALEVGGLYPIPPAQAQHLRVAMLGLFVLLLVGFNIQTLSAQEDDSIVIIPLFEDDRYVGKFPNPVAPDRRDSNNFIRVNGVSFDQVTQLAWQSQDDGVARTWSDAYAYCKSIRLLNRSDWRLPTFHELLSIYDFVPVDFANPRPAINETTFPNTKHDDALNGEYWTATQDIERESVQRTGSWFFVISFTLNTNTNGDQLSFFRYRAIADNSFDSSARAYTRCVL